MICVVLCKVLQPIALKTKKLRRKVSQIKAQCSCINGGARFITYNCTINSVENGTRFSYDVCCEKDIDKICLFFFNHTFELFETIGKSCARIIFELFVRMRVANNVARIQIPAWTPYVRWICYWFFALLREIFFPVHSGSPYSSKII